MPLYHLISIMPATPTMHAPDTILVLPLVQVGWSAAMRSLQPTMFPCALVCKKMFKIG